MAIFGQTAMELQCQIETNFVILVFYYICQPARAGLYVGSSALRLVKARVTANESSFCGDDKYFLALLGQSSIQNAGRREGGSSS